MGCERNVFGLLRFSCFVTVPYEVFLQPMSLPRPSCATFVVTFLGPFTSLLRLRLSSSALGVPKVRLRPLANDHFLLRLSPDLGGVSLFRIHCQKAALVRLSRLGCLTFFVYVMSSFLFLQGFQRCHFAPWGMIVFPLPEPGFRWCLAVSDPLPSGCRCAFVATYWGSFLFL